MHFKYKWTDVTNDIAFLCESRKCTKPQENDHEEKGSGLGCVHVGQPNAIFQVNEFLWKKWITLKGFPCTKLLHYKNENLSVNYAVYPKVLPLFIQSAYCILLFIISDFRCLKNRPAHANGYYLCKYYCFRLQVLCKSIPILLAVYWTTL